jgi:hypothetical protein
MDANQTANSTSSQFDLIEAQSRVIRKILRLTAGKPEDESQRDAALHPQTIHDDDDCVWKILVFDPTGQDILSTLFRVRLNNPSSLSSYSSHHSCNNNRSGISERRT